MTKFYLEIEQHPFTGEAIHSYAQCEDDMELPGHAECWVPRLPEPFEQWDDEAKVFVLDVAAKAKHEMGDALVSEMRGRKLAQAEMVAAGITAIRGTVRTVTIAGDPDYAGGQDVFVLGGERCDQNGTTRLFVLRKL